MKLSVKKFAELTGVSVRTLHYYDEIGLLKPEYVDNKNSYRYYGEESLCRMQEILFYRELDFSLSTIQQLLSSQNYDKKEALSQQKKLLILKKQRLDRIISAIECIEKGEDTMNFEVFSESEINAYKDEVKTRWGETEAYKEHCEKTKNYSSEKWTDIGEGMNAIISEFAVIMKLGRKPDSDEANTLVKKLQDFITEYQYTCTNGILACLGEMYVADERFTENIDRHGIGTAEFMSNAIKEYCK